VSSLDMAVDGVAGRRHGIRALALVGTLLLPWPAGGPAWGDVIAPPLARPQDQSRFRVSVFATGLAYLTSMAQLADGSLLVATSDGGSSTNPQSQWGEGFWIPQVIAPWMPPQRFHEKQQEYDRDRVLNEVFGLPTMHGTLAITRAELEACCAPRPMAQSVDDVPPAARQSLLLGIDWGMKPAAPVTIMGSWSCGIGCGMRPGWGTSEVAASTIGEPSAH